MPRALPALLTILFLVSTTSTLKADPFFMPPGWIPFPWEPVTPPPPPAPLFPAAGPTAPPWLNTPAELPGAQGAAGEGSSFFDNAVDLPGEAPVPDGNTIFTDGFDPAGSGGFLDDSAAAPAPGPAAPVDAPAPNNVPAPAGPAVGGIAFRIIQGGLALISITNTLDRLVIYDNNHKLCWENYHENMRAEMQNLIWAYNMEDPRAILGVLGVSIPPGMPLNYSEKLFCEMNWNTQIKDKLQQAGAAAERKFNKRFRDELPWGEGITCGADIDGINLDAFVTKQISICAKLHPTLCGKRVASGTELVSPRLWDPQTDRAKTAKEFCADNNLLPGMVFSMKSSTVFGGITPNTCPCN